MMLDAVNIRPKDEDVVQFLRNVSLPIFLVVNKIDLVSKETILPIMDRFSHLHHFQEIIPISALKSEGLDILLSRVLKTLPEGEPFYPPNTVSDAPERFFVAEIIREQIFFQYGEEIPYATSVQIETFQEKPGRKDVIQAVVFVERNSQKGILIGKGGQALKKVGMISRKEIEAFLGRPVFLEIKVRVKKKWRKDANLVKELGYL